jgi:hypothetical protein
MKRGTGANVTNLRSVGNEAVGSRQKTKARGMKRGTGAKRNY